VKGLQVKKGRDRVVIILPRFGIVIKFPIVHFIRAMRGLNCYNYKGMRLEYLRKYLTWKMIVYGGFRRRMFGGLYANIYEFCFYQRTRNSFLQPTYFSFFGVVNFQRYDQPCKLEEIDLWCQLQELTNGKVWDDAHHFSSLGNYCLKSGKIRMLDYGSSRCYEVISQYGESIAESFDIDYHYHWPGNDNIFQKDT